MKWDQRTWIRAAALSAFVAVAAGAFAAHGAGDAAARDLLRTGAQYQMVHALGVLACASLFGAPAGRATWAPALFLAGSLLFSGSLYALALGAPRLIGAVTPVGGLMFLAGWAALAWSAGLARAGVDRHSGA